MSDKSICQPAWEGKGFRLGLFASGDKTGNYVNRCHGCGCSFIGDKRAKECLPCAAASATAALASKDAEIERLRGKKPREPFLPADLEDETEVTSREWHARVLRTLADQLGLGNDFYFPLLGAAQLIDGMTRRGAERATRAAGPTPHPRSEVPGFPAPGNHSSDPE